jgi:tetratricopeptide (TPR) repeat protein
VASYRPLTPGENLEITRIIQNPLYLSEILSDPLKGINYLENLHEGLTNVDQTATVLLTRAFILIHFGKYEKSTRLFKLISQIYPDYKLYLAGLGYVEFLNENYTKAHLLFEQAYAHLKRNLFINYNLARLKYLRGEYVLAQKLLNKGLKLAPESTLFTNFLNFIAQRQNGKQINASPNQIRIKITVFFCENSALFWVVPLVLTAIMGILGIRGAMQNNLSITVYCFISVIINSFIIVTYLKPFFSHYIMNDEWDVIIDDVFMLNRKNSISKWLIYGTVMTLTTFGLAGPLFLIVLYLFFPQYRFLFNNKK